MADVFSKRKRSQVMASIRSTETKLEIEVRKLLFSEGFRFRKNSKSLPGKPDIVLSRYKTIIFVNGCFWHGHNLCKYAVTPKTNKKFWIDKIKSNIARDKQKKTELNKLGWKVITIWECEIKKLFGENSAARLKLVNSIKKNRLAIF
jgi:DNA mismatch endonuclease (patch repair protein)